MRRLSDPVPSKDGTKYVYTINEWDPVTNKKTTNMWLGSLLKGDTSVKKIASKFFVTDYNPLWTPDMKTILFLSTRSGSSQIWGLSLSDLEKPYKISNFPVDVSTMKLYADGTGVSVALSASVYPNMTMAQTAEKDREVAASRVNAQRWDSLMIRRWDDWWVGKFNHVFVSKLRYNAVMGQWAIYSDPVDVMPAMNSDCPSKPFGGAEEYDLSPDLKTIAITTQAHKEIAWTTDLNVLLIDLNTLATTCITCDNPASDTAPVFSPNGKLLAYSAMKKPGYESDRLRLAVYDIEKKTSTILSEDFEVSTGADKQWSSDMKKIYYTGWDNARSRFFSFNIEDKTHETILADHYVTGVSFVPCLEDQKKTCKLFAMQTFQLPTEIFISTSDDKLTQLTKSNDNARFNFGAPEEFHHKGANGDDILTWVFKPSDFDATKKYPMILFIHGGPEDPWFDQFHYRWNPYPFTSQGYVVAMPNFHGSASFGDKFKEDIIGDWGGKPYQDILMSVEAVANQYPWVDGTNVGAMGASYGGFMINWINSQGSGRFKCLVCHDGMFDPFAMYYYTEELYFVEKEFGAAPFVDDTLYRKWNPSLNVDKMDTPQMTIHGSKDYRIPDVSGFGVFTALQRRGIESVLIRLPEENHFVLNPNNSIYWHQSIIEWMDKHLKM